MTKKIFISYRRVDAEYAADRVYRSLFETFPQDNVFMDVDTILPGMNFRKILKKWVDQCDILLALIGPNWIDCKDPKTGDRRLDNEQDDTLALYSLGHLYDYGYGVPKDISKACAYYQRASDKRNESSKARLQELSS